MPPESSPSSSPEEPTPQPSTPPEAPAPRQPVVSKKLTLETGPQAKILKGREIRTFVIVLIVGATIFGLKWVLSNRNDPDFGVVDTIGMVEALEYGEGGQHVVVFGADGKKITQGNLKPNVDDRDPVWRPDGNRIFFVSDREGKGYQLFRWLPQADAEASVRSQGSLGKSNPTFPVGSADAKAAVLMVSGGFVLEFDPSDLKGHQILPPTGNAPTQSTEEGAGGGSSTGQFSAVYGDMGTSFRIAKWCAGGDAVAGVMEGDRGETLVIQPISKPGEPVKRPIFLAGGQHIEFDVSAKDGSVVYSVEGFRWEGDSKMPKDQRPRHFIGLWKPGEDKPSVVIASASDNTVFGAPAISPLGDKLLVTVGTFDLKTEQMIPLGLVTMPVQDSAGGAVAKLVQGAVYEPSWSPKGDLIAYAKVANNSRAIYIAGADGSNEHTLTGDTGRYGYPKFSPQVKP